MKRFMKWASGVLLLTVMMVMVLPATEVKAQYGDDYVSYQTFYDDLSPYGQWVNDPQYGNVWVPDVPGDFRPYYTRGYWVATEYGNTWVSDYPWGWAAFHYGRWTYNPFYGWVWIPGNTWGPAWVSWRWGGGYAGWAPMGPGVSLSMSIGNYGCPNDWWVFVGPQHLYSPRFHSYWRGPRYNNTYIRNTTIINNTYNNTYVYGPRPNEVERVTHQRVNVHRVGRGNRGNTVVNNNTVNIYRPQIRGEASDHRPREVVRAPREIGKPQSVRNTRPEFRSMVNRGELTPVNNNGRNDRADRFDRSDRSDRVRPQPAQRRDMDRPNTQQDRVERPQDQRLQRMERPQPRQMDRPQQQAPRQMDRPQRTERPQMQRPQRQMERPQMDRPQQQRVERPQMQRPQRQVERPQMQRPQQQRVERPQMQRPQRQMERPQQRPQQQRMERPQMQRAQPRMERPQSAPRPQPQQSRPSGGGDRGRGGR